MITAVGTSHTHHDIIVNDIAICNCGRVLKYDSYDRDPNVKPVVIKEGHVPGIEITQISGQVAVFYEGVHWASLSVGTPELEHITHRIIQSVAKCYLREGSLTNTRCLRDQVKIFIDKGLPDEQIIDEFPKEKKDTIRRYIRDIKKEKEKKHGNGFQSRSK